MTDNQNTNKPEQQDGKSGYGMSNPIGQSKSDPRGMQGGSQGTRSGREENEGQQGKGQQGQQQEHQGQNQGEGRKTQQNR